MAVRDLCKFKDPILKQKCSPVTTFDDSLYQLIKDMRDTMQYNRGCGLAAPQIGSIEQVIIVQRQKCKGVYAIINPEITEQSFYTNTAPEACLSYPGISKMISRPLSVTVKGKNIQGEDISIHAAGFEARILCHEIDHLEGSCKLAG